MNAGLLTVIFLGALILLLGFGVRIAFCLGFIGVAGIFWLMVALALIGIAITEFVVPKPVRVRHHRDAETVPGLIGSVLRNTELLRLDIGVFAEFAAGAEIADIVREGAVGAEEFLRHVRLIERLVIQARTLPQRIQVLRQIGCHGRRIRPARRA